MKIGGGIMVVMGVILFFDQLTFLNSLLQPIFKDFNHWRTIPSMNKKTDRKVIFCLFFHL